VYAAAAVRVSAPQSKFFSHSVYKSISGAFNVAMLEHELSELRQDTESVCAFLEARTGTAAVCWNQMMDASTTLSPLCALEFGLVTRVGLPALPSGGCDCEILGPALPVPKDLYPKQLE